MLFLHSLRKLRQRHPAPALKPTIYYVPVVSAAPLPLSGMRRSAEPGLRLRQLCVLRRVGVRVDRVVAALAPGGGLGAGRSRELTVLDQRHRGTRFLALSARSVRNAPASTHTGFWSSIPMSAVSSAVPTATRDIPIARPSSVRQRRYGGRPGARRCRPGPPSKSASWSRPTSPSGWPGRSTLPSSPISRSSSAPPPIPTSPPSAASGSPGDPRAAAAFHGLRIGIITKSPLVARDIDVLQPLSERNEVTVNVSIATLDPASPAASSLAPRCRPPASGRSAGWRGGNPRRASPRAHPPGRHRRRECLTGCSPRRRRRAPATRPVRRSDLVPRPGATSFPISRASSPSWRRATSGTTATAKA